MRTRQQIEDKLNKMIEHLDQSPRLTASEKDLTHTLLSELKDEFARERENYEIEVDRLDATEIFHSQMAAKTTNVIRFRPRNSIED